MKNTILITGGSGMIGNYLSELLSAKEYSVNHLSRSKTGKEKYKTYKWDIEKEEIEIEALEAADFIVHLAGANVAEKRWTNKRKQNILESRTKTADLLYKKLSEKENNVKAVISASGVGIYGTDTGNTLVSENFKYGNDFLAEVTKAWEAGVKKVESLNIREVRLRIGIVLANEGGALPKLLEPVKYGIGAPLGSGNQFYSWIHIQDLCRMFLEAIENENMRGVYNAVAPNPVTNKEFTQILASKLNRPLILPKVPGFVLKLMLGELSNVVLGGNKVSSAKVQSEGFKFLFNDLGEAIEDLILRKNKD